VSELVLDCRSLASQPPPSPDGVEVSIDATAKTSVREILDRYRIVPRKRFGQNFLHDPAVAARIAALTGVGPGDRVLEIGPGLGALTRPLLASGAAVVAVEVDRRIAEYLRESLEGDFELHVGDVLRLDLDAVAPDPVTLVANLPYSITGPVLALLIEQADRFPRACMMVQREVGARLVAAAGSRELGAPAVLLRLLYHVRRAFDVGRGAFLPAPEIVSTVLTFDRLAGQELAPGLRDAVNTAYRQRRKMLRKTLKGIVATEDSIASALMSIGQPDSARPEELAPEEWPAWIAAAQELER
jgi:16S rRNA (adenine1518-N6/adenine1519-N6)-dimethyltransferase